MNKKTRSETTGAVFILCVAIVLFIVFIILPIWIKPANNEVTIKVEGQKDLNLSEGSLTYVVLDCVKYCSDKFDGEYSYLTQCYDQCQKIAGGIKC